MCVDVFCGVLYVGHFIVKMDVFSLKDEDTSGLFNTQESNNNSYLIEEKSDDENCYFLGLSADDFTSPCPLIVSKKVYTPQCSDISDDETAFGNPKTQ